MPPLTLRRIVLGMGGLAAILLAVLLGLRSVNTIYVIGEPFARPSGYSIDVRYFPTVGGPCYLIRVTADDCPYCQRDQEEYARVVSAARSRGCQLLTISPSVGDVALKPEQTVPQVQYVNMAFGRALYPFLTPQTILLDENATIRWFHLGSLAEEDVVEAARNIGSLR